MNFRVSCDLLDLINGVSSRFFLSVNVLDRCQGSFSLGQSKRRFPCPHHAGIQTVNVPLHSFLICALREDHYPVSHLDRFIPGEISPLPVQ